MTGSQPCEHPALIGGSREVPPTTRPRLVTNGPRGTDSSEDEDTKPIAAEERRKAKKSKRDRGRECTKRKLEQDVNKKGTDTGKNETKAAKKKADIETEKLEK